MVEFSRIGSTTPAQPRRIHEKAQTPRTVPDEALAHLGCFCCSCGKLSASEILIPAEILSGWRVDERKNSQSGLFYRCFPEKAVKLP
jgi:hypothetical protein